MEITIKDLVQLLAGEFYERGIPDLIPRETRVPDVAGKIIAVVGMRRSGKTTFLFQLIGDLLRRGVPRSSILYVNFEDDRLLPIDRTKFAAILDSFYALHPENHDRQVHFFLDEIQNAAGWANVLRRYLDTRSVRIFITGSSSKLLSQEIATSLRGRSLACEIWPFNFRERLRALGSSLPREPVGPAARDRVQKELLDFIQQGGFPETVGLDRRDRILILQEYVQVVVLRDLVERHRITNISVLRYLIKNLLSNVARTFSVNKFYNDVKSQGLKIGKNTLHDYLAYVQDSFLAFLVPIRAESIRKRQVNPRKVYAVDPGLVQAFCFRSGDFGHLFENVVYLDLRRAGFDVSYHITKSGYEVDFVARTIEGEERLYQVTYDASDPNTFERERRAVDEAHRELGLEAQLITPENYSTEFLGSLPTAAEG